MMLEETSQQPEEKQPPVIPGISDDGTDSADETHKYTRSGKWTEEEEAYSMKLIEAFFVGILSIPKGTSLRKFLADSLCCDPMRISKKFAGSSGIGKQLYMRNEHYSDKGMEARKVLERDLAELEKKFYKRVDFNPPIGSLLKDTPDAPLLYPISDDAPDFSAHIPRKYAEHGIASIIASIAPARVPKHLSAFACKVDQILVDGHNGSDDYTSTTRQKIEKPRKIVPQLTLAPPINRSNIFRKESVGSSVDESDPLDLQASAMLLDFFHAAQNQQHEFSWMPALIATTEPTPPPLYTGSSTRSLSSPSSSEQAPPYKRPRVNYPL